jgi:hypothetical protein
MDKESVTFIYDSRDITSGTPENGEIVLSPPIKQFDYCWVKNVFIPTTFNNVDTWNNQFTLNFNGTNTTFTINPSLYSIQTLCTAIQNALNTFDTNGHWTVAISYPFSDNLEITRMVLITCTPTGNDLRSLMFGTYTKNSIAPTLGLQSVNSPYVSGSFTIRGPYCVENTFPHFLQIRSIRLGSSILTPSIWQGRPSYVIHTVVGNQYSNSVTWNYQYQKVKMKGNPNMQPLDRLDFQLTDDRGNQINLNNSQQGWQIEIIFVRKNKTWSQ